jgi:hypothetical protein
MQAPEKISRDHETAKRRIGEGAFPDRLPTIPYDGHPIYSSSAGAIRLRDRLFALARVAQMSAYVMAVRIAQLVRRKRWGGVADGGRIAANLAQDGLSVRRLPPPDRALLLEAAKPFFDRLANVRDRIARGSRGYLDNQLDLLSGEAPSLFELLEGVLSSSGVLQGIRYHLGCEAKLRKVTIQINDEWDTYWRAHFQKRGLEVPPTAFFHMDNTYGVAKVIFYASTVGADNGPFSYVPGTHKIPIGNLESLILRATDIWLDVYPKERPLFLALPSFLRKKAKFGDDLEADSDWGRWLLAREKVVTSIDGDLIVFDVQGTHRGGMVVRGERQILQLMIS